MKRRGFLKAVGAAAAVALLPHARSTSAAPLIPAHSINHAQPVWVNVRDFGAKGDGVTDDRAAFRRAWKECLRLGGGTVFIPGGVYRAYPFDLMDIPRGSKITFLGTGSREPGKRSQLVPA